MRQLGYKMKYTVIDFETANSRRNSPCAIGIVVVEDGKIIEEKAYYIKPFDMYFSGFNIAIHGIKPSDVENAMTFDVLYEEIKHYFINQVVLAHNASFDMSVLRAILAYYEIPFPNLKYICTVKVAKRMWPFLEKHSLDRVSNYLDFTFKHHDAFDDARACANIMIKSLEDKNLTDPFELLDMLNIKPGLLFAGGYKPCSTK